MIDPLLEVPSEIEPDKRDNIQYWLKWIKGAKKGADTSWKQVKAAYDEFLRTNVDEGDTLAGSGKPTGWYPIYTSSVETIGPAYYSRTPKITTVRAFEGEDDQSGRLAKMLKRIGRYLVDNCPYDDAMIGARSDFINASKTTTQLVYEADKAMVKTRKPLTGVPQSVPPGDSINQQLPTSIEPIAPQMDYIDEAGAIYEGEVLQDEQGFFYNLEEGKAVNQKISIVALPYDEYIHNPEAKAWHELTDVGLKFCLNYQDAVKRFGEDKVNKVQECFKLYSAYNTETETQREDNPDMPGKFIHGWEIWCKYTKKVYWVCEGYNDDFLDVKEDPYKLRDFFPVPKLIIANKPPKSLYPTNAHTHLKEIIGQLHSAQGRVYRLLKTARRRVIVDGAEPEVIDLLNAVDGEEFVTSTNMRGIVEKGGLANLIWVAPVEEFVKAIGELQSAEEEFKNQFYEWFGVPDILRGSSDPLETAAAQEIKQGSAHDRFKYAKKQIQQLARDSIELMVDLALKVFDDEKMASICGYQYLDPIEQQNFIGDLTLLRNDEERIVRIAIETDSTNFINEAQRRQEATQLLQTVVSGLKEVSGMIQVSPEYAAVALNTLVCVLDTMPGGSNEIAEIKASTKKLIEAAMNPPPQPERPDYEMLKLQNEQMKVNLLQLKQQAENTIKIEELKLQIANQTQEATIKQRELGIREAEFGLKQQGALLESNVSTEELRLKGQELVIEEQKIGTEAQLKAFKASIDAKYLELDTAQQKAEQMIEGFRVASEAKNKELDNKRLQLEAVLEAAKIPMEAAKAQPQQQPHFTIVNQLPKSGAKKARIVRDALGNSDITIDDLAGE